MVLVETDVDTANNPVSAAQIQAEAAPTLTADQLTPTPQPTATLALTSEPTVTPTPEVVASSEPDEVAVDVPEEVEEEPAQPTPAPPPQAAAPQITPISAPATGAAAVAPFALVGLGCLYGGLLMFGLAIIFGSVFGKRSYISKEEITCYWEKET